MHYSDNSISKRICWESDFTRKLPNGLWDNHEVGHGDTPDIAIENAYANIKNGIKFKIKK